MVSTNSTTMQSLGKIVQCAPAVGAKIWCLWLCFFLSCAPRLERFSLEGDIVRTSIVWQFIGRFWCGFQIFFQKGSAFQMQYMILIFVASWRQKFREMAVKNCKNSKSRQKSLCPPLHIDIWGIWKKLHCSCLGPRMYMCTYIKFFFARRYMTASVKVRIDSPKMARYEQDCSHQKSQYRKWIFEKHLWRFYAREGL